MTDLKKNFCILCGTIIVDKTFQIIEDTTKNIFRVLLLQVDLDHSECMMCNICYKSIFAAFHFKARCLYSNSIIVSHANDDRKSLHNLRDIYIKENGHNQLMNIPSDMVICRLCFQPIINEFGSILDVAFDLIEQFLPELNFSESQQSVMCKQCFDSIKAHATFLNSYQNSQPSTEDNAIEERYNDIEEIKIKTESSDLELPCKPEYIHIKSIENEEAFKSDSIPIKTEVDDDVEVMCGENSNLSCNVDPTKKTNSQNGRKPKNKYVFKCRVKKILKPKVADRQKTYKCPLCVFETKLKLNLKIHSSKHKDSMKVEDILTMGRVKKYKCDQCDYKSNRKAYLTTHKLKHKDFSEVPLHKCDTCSFQTKYRSNLVAHLVKHKDPSEIQMYKCDKCDYATKQKRFLKHHQLRHKEPLEVMMYRCGSCDYETNIKTNFKFHQLKHKDPSEVETYECGHCPYITLRKDHLTSHQLKHKNRAEVQMYKCEQCDYETVRKRNLKSHQVTHKDASEVTMFKCDQCEYEGKTKGLLTSHLLRHVQPSKVDMYKCGKCDFETKGKCYLKRHILRHKEPSEVETYQRDKFI